MTVQAAARGVARGGLANLAGAGFTAAAGLAVAWLAARGLGPARAGVFFAAVAAFTLAAGVAKLGTPTGLVYWLARFRARGEADRLRPCLRAGLVPVLATGGALAVGLWIAAPALGTAIAGPVHGDTAAAGLRALAPLLPLAAVTDALLAATRGARFMRPTVVIDKLLRPGLQVLAIAALAAVPLATVAAWTAAWALPYLPAALLAAAAATATVRYAPRPAPGAAPVAGWFWRFTGPRAVASVLQLALQRLDILLVAALAGPVPAALYTVAGRFVLLGQLANQALGYPLQPRLAERLGSGDQVGAGDRMGAGALYRTTTCWLVLTTWPLYLVVLGYAPLYLGLFGGDYRSAAPVVAVLAGAMLLATGCGPVDMLLAMAGRTGWQLLNVAVALAAMVAVDLALVPRYGALGAAVGLAVAVAANNLLPLAQVGFLLRVHPFGPGTLAAAGLAATCFGGLPALVRALAGTAPGATATALLLAGAAYLGGAYRLRRPLALTGLLAAARTRTRTGCA